MEEMDMDMYLKSLTNEDLIQIFVNAVNYMPGRGAKGRSEFHDTKAELLRRLEGADHE